MSGFITVSILMFLSGGAGYYVGRRGGIGVREDLVKAWTWVKSLFGK